jgi:Flp pilus assembly protein TadD
LLGQGRFPEAEAACRAALLLQPDLPQAHTNLGNALKEQGRHKEAEAAYRAALRLQPDLPLAHSNLGAALCEQGRWQEAEAACRKALLLQPDYPDAHNNLGLALDGQGRFPEAEAEHRVATRLQPDDPKAHYNLGRALYRQGRFPEAEAAFREALLRKPNFPDAHNNLGLALAMQGRFREGQMAAREVLRIAAPGDLKRRSAEQMVRLIERLIELDRKLSAVLDGKAEPANAAERLNLADLAQQPFKRLYTTAARLYADAFAADPRLADDLGQQHRYNAACSAALAAAGQAADARSLPDKVVLTLRRQALAWLRADLALYAKLAEREDPKAQDVVRERLTHWQQDSDLASVRDQAALGKLPDDEREPWRQLWDGVAALLKKVGEKK